MNDPLRKVMPDPLRKTCRSAPPTTPGVTMEQLASGKGQLRGGMVLGLEDSATRRFRIAKADLLYDDLPGTDNKLARTTG